MQDFQKNLVAAWTDYVAGTIDAKALKGQSAGFGIYQQRDDKTMMRVRRVGGHITTDDFRNAANILRTHGGDYAHLTTRQDIQLHGVPAAQVTTALAACESVGFRFRGGGGDTFRNTLVSAYSGLHEDSVFDVVPYAKALSDAFYAFDLGRGKAGYSRYHIRCKGYPAALNLVQLAGNFVICCHNMPSLFNFSDIIPDISDPEKHHMP